MEKRAGEPGPHTPTELADLVRAADDGRDVAQAWSAFLAQHSQLLLSAVRSRNGDHDRTMDRYAFLIESLRADDFRRLRAYHPDGRTKFSTWLVVVAKRLMVDDHRRRYGRPQGGGEKRTDDQNLVRRRLVDLIASDADLATVEDTTAPDPERAFVHRERRLVLESVIAALDSSDRLLITLRFVDGATAGDIADVMGFPSQFHVYRALRRVTRTLKKTLKQRGIQSLADL